MKTRRSGSRSSWPSNQASRRLRTSGRSCSAACAVFFHRDPASLEEAPQAAIPDRNAPLGQGRPKLLQRDVRLGLVERHHQIAVSFDHTRALIAAHRPRACVALLALQHPPAAHAGRADPETLTGLTMAQPRGDCRQHANSEIQRERCRHACRPPPGRHSESRTQPNRNPKSDSHSSITF